MSTMQFIACRNEKCPMNTLRSCRAEFLHVNNEGKCLVQDGAPGGQKAGIENYVEMKECQCHTCKNWSVDSNTGMGNCNFGLDLCFDPQGICEEYKNQPKEPGFSATL